MASPPPPVSAGSETSEDVDSLAQQFHRCEAAIGAYHAVVIVPGLR